MFTTPAAPVERAAKGDRLDCGPTRWPVVALRVGTQPLTEPLPPRVLELPSTLVVEQEMASQAKRRLGTAAYY